MEEHKKIEISLLTLIIALIVIIGIIVTTVLIFKDTDKKKDKSEEMEIQNNVIPNEIPNEIPNGEIDENTDFELSFLKMEQNKKNMLYSPLSIKYALNMLDEGANGNTKKQIDKLIKDLDTTKYENIDEVLSLANGLYIRDTYADYLKEEYIDILEDKYNAEVKYDKFKNADNINKWIENKTLGQIKNLLRDEQVANPDNKMALINALAIDMEWKNRFDTGDTYGVDFYLEDGKTIKATTMNQKIEDESASYYKDENVTVLSMDLKEYDDTQLEFIAIMPKEDLSKYVEKVTMEDIDNITKELKSASETKAGIDISIPRFSYDYSIKLQEELKLLGITDAFDTENADFTNMTDREGFCVGNAIHKANIDFTEKGVKAAAVTVIMMKENSAIMEEERPEEVKIDNPFMYLIRDKKTGEIWFVGTVYEPNSWEDDKADYEYR